jgi:hypothetical protein
VDDCNAYRRDWEQRREEVLRDHPEGQAYTDRIVVKDDMGNPLLDPKTGKPITEARSEMRGVGAQPDQEQRNSDAVYMLRNTYLKECPFTVPGVSRDGYSLTPAGALEFWKEQDNKPLPGAVMQRKTSGLTASMLAAAVDEANEAGKVRDAEEEAAEKERQRLARIKAEQDRLAQIAAEKAAKERAAQLAAEQADQERQAKAAARASAASGASGSSSNASSNARRASSGPSVCYRNADKYVADYQAAGVQMYAATYDLFYAEIQLQMTKLWEPCISYDKDARYYYDKNLKAYNDVQAYCAGPHGEWECTQWGAGGHQQEHMNALQWSREEVQRLLASSGAGSHASAASTAKMGSASSTLDLSPDSSGQGSGDQVSAACRDGLSKLGDEGNAINSRKPPDASTIATIQVGLYIIDRSLKFLDSSCKGQPEYRQYADLKRAYDQTMTTCSQIASSTSYCVPKLAW